uniref:Uncharacterized protein n=1 Tax=Anopheles maculatus TaxID=74869 RepID=A0A182SUA6_9DIPT
ASELNTLDHLDNDSDELLRQLTENTFELEQFFQDFPATEIKVEENNNDLQLDEEANGQIFLQNCSQFLTSAAAAAQLSALSVSEPNELDAGLQRLCSGGNDQLVGSGTLTTQQLQEQLLIAQAQGLLQQNRFNNSLLAEKLLQNHHQQQQHLHHPHTTSQNGVTNLDALGVPSSSSNNNGNNHHNGNSSNGSSSSHGGRANKPPDIVIKGKGWLLSLLTNEERNVYLLHRLAKDEDTNIKIIKISVIKNKFRSMFGTVWYLHTFAENNDNFTPK